MEACKTHLNRGKVAVIRGASCAAPRHVFLCKFSQSVKLRTTAPRSGLSFRLSSAQRRDNLAKLMASSRGQSRTAGSSISAKSSKPLAETVTFHELHQDLVLESSSARTSGTGEATKK
ncbi:LOW QUALITY PROTEIN: hypothetical protein NC651_015530 [Populus alba x Populus x berolinensis]|nr:LOW QUALITY PROTEIN: hypothetical protein NC651_015530 [Populus alba x Populus x berolinensis]